jgi:hypothetical protein
MRRLSVGELRDGDNRARAALSSRHSTEAFSNPVAKGIGGVWHGVDTFFSTVTACGVVVVSFVYSQLKM